MQRVRRGAAGRGQLPGPQERPRRQRIFADAFRRFRQPHLPRQIIGFDLRDSFQAEECVFVTPRRGEKLRGLAILFHGLVRPVLLLLQKGVTRDALRRLLCGVRTQESVVKR